MGHALSTRQREENSRERASAITAAANGTPAAATLRPVAASSLHAGQRVHRVGRLERLRLRGNTFPYHLPNTYSSTPPSINNLISSQEISSSSSEPVSNGSGQPAETTPAVVNAEQLLASSIINNNTSVPPADNQVIEFNVRESASSAHQAIARSLRTLNQQILRSSISSPSHHEPDFIVSRLLAAVANNIDPFLMSHTVYPMDSSPSFERLATSIAQSLLRSSALAPSPGPIPGTQTSVLDSLFPPPLPSHLRDQVPLQSSVSSSSSPPPPPHSLSFLLESLHSMSQSTPTEHITASISTQSMNAESAFYRILTLATSSHSSEVSASNRTESQIPLSETPRSSVDNTNMMPPPSLAASSDESRGNATNTIPILIFGIRGSQRDLATSANEHSDRPPTIATSTTSTIPSTLASSSQSTLNNNESVTTTLSPSLLASSTIPSSIYEASFFSSMTALPSLASRLARTMSNWITPAIPLFLNSLVSRTEQIASSSTVEVSPQPHSEYINSSDRLRQHSPSSTLLANRDSSRDTQNNIPASTSSTNNDTVTADINPSHVRSNWLIYIIVSPSLLDANAQSNLLAALMSQQFSNLSYEDMLRLFPSKPRRLASRQMLEQQRIWVYRHGMLVTTDVEIAILTSKNEIALKALGGTNIKCTICLTEYETDDTLRHLSCCHVFHKDCLDTWLTTQANTCPMCRSEAIVEITSEESHPFLDSTPTFNSLLPSPTSSASVLAPGLSHNRTLATHHTESDINQVTPANTDDDNDDMYTDVDDIGDEEGNGNNDHGMLDQFGHDGNGYDVIDWGTVQRVNQRYRNALTTLPIVTSSSSSLPSSTLTSIQRSPFDTTTAALVTSSFAIRSERLLYSTITRPSLRTTMRLRQRQARGSLISTYTAKTRTVRSGRAKKHTRVIRRRLRIANVTESVAATASTSDTTLDANLTNTTLGVTTRAMRRRLEAERGP